MRKDADSRRSLHRLHRIPERHPFPGAVKKLQLLKRKQRRQRKRPMRQSRKSRRSRRARKL